MKLHAWDLNLISCNINNFKTFLEFKIIFKFDQILKQT